MTAFRMTALAAMFATTVVGSALAQGAMSGPTSSMAAPATSSMAAPKDSMAMGKPMAGKKKAAKKSAMKPDAMKSDSMAAPAH
jgi:hypothetical protein